jgi:translocation and assembly module TamB
MIKFIFRLPLILLETLVVPIALVAALGGSIYYLGETSAGLQTTVKLFNKFSASHLEVKTARGKLFSHFILTGINYTDATTHASLSDLEFAWEPHKLLEDKLHIQRLVTHNVVITSNDATSASVSLEDISYYLKHIRIDAAEISHLSYAQGQQSPYVIEKISLQQNGLKNFTFAAKIANGSIAGTLTDEWNARWNFTLADLGVLAPQSQGNIILNGTITGPRFTPTLSANLSGKNLAYSEHTVNQLTADVNLVLKPETQSFITLRAAGVKISGHPLAPFTLSASGKTSKLAGNWATALNISLNNKPYLTLALAVPQTLKMDNYDTLPISAQLNVNPVNLNLLAKYVPQIKNLQGTLQGAFVLDGNLQHPRLNGNLALNNGNATIPELGITLKNITLRATADESKILNYSGSFQSENGKAMLKGTTDLSQTGFPTTLSLQGNNLLIMNLEEYKIHVSPDLTATLSGTQLALHGKLFIPQAKISPKNFNGVVTLPTDVVFVGEEKKVSKPSALLADLPVMQLTVTLGDDIFLHYQDLEAKLRGTLQISKDTLTPATGVGEFYATRGTYNAYKKVLTIKEGRLIYTGNLITNPGLNIKATRDMETVSTGAVSNFTSTQTYTGTEKLTVGVQVLGTLNKPQISLFSIPTLSQVDTLSYLILGIPASQASDSTNHSLLSAASALNLGSDGASSHLAAITQNIQKTFGLTELNVQSVQTFNPTSGVVSTPSLVVGKQISSKLYVHYSTSFDFMKPISTFNLRYKLSKRFSIQSETSTIDTGADLLYSIERG